MTDGEWTDPALVATDALPGSPVAWCRELTRSLAGHAPASATRRWCEQWATIDAVTRVALHDGLRRIPVPFEGRIFDELADLLPDGAVCVVGNSMPVRDLDTFFPGGARPLRFLANRGASGIDGVVSTALGVAATSAAPVVLVLGDLSFYHDMNGLLAARRHGLSLTVVLVNNDGGGIFSFLPQAEVPEHFEQLFGTPHGLDFGPAAALYGATHSRPTSWEAFRSAVSAGLTGGLHLVEVRTDRNENVGLHRELWQEVASALRRGRSY